MNSKKLRSTLMATAVVMALVMLGVAVAVCANNACAQSNQGKNKITDYSMLNSELSPLWDKVTTTTQQAQWTLSGLQGDLGALMSRGESVGVQGGVSMNDRINMANTYVNNWGSEKQDLMDKLSGIESRVDYSAMSDIDAAKARGKIAEMKARVNQLDIVMSQMKDSLGMINKYT